MCIAGLLNVTGTVDGGAVSDSLDALVDLIAILQTNLATPSHILVGPLGWSELRNLKTPPTPTTPRFWAREPVMLKSPSP
jgi:hypothetical protein